MGARHLVVTVAISLAAFATVGPLHAQDHEEWRLRFAAGEEARKASDYDRYADEMAASARALPDAEQNRPLVQYHAARSAALAGRAGDAVSWLTKVWDEGVDALMVSFALGDSAFDTLRGDAGFEALLSRAANTQLEVRPLGGQVYLISGVGSNLIAQVSDDGVFLVDTGYRLVLPAVRSALAGLGGQVITHLLVTHPHEDHMGGAEEIGRDAVVIAHPATALAMQAPYALMDGVTLPPKAASALPKVSVDSDTTIVVGGEPVRIVPTVAHTPGDLSIYFTESDVAHLGDAYLATNPMMFPGQVDPEGFLDSLEAFLDEMGPSTVIVGGHEGVGDVAAVRAQIDVSRACMSFVRESLGDGLSLEQTARAGMERFPLQWIAFFYGVLSRG